ncbi:small ribosomal subunit biogenesis GTPase RsgA [Agarivorans sp. B2Z047]|uniref:small ribosomal subunit biogenesis GTPase RsgA n=1 Tax=Agarivorans sp. B2Z047 TaxID=2652721 RepID=UPI0014067487|nr:small ribosomal subunit biogenesis GTPase RsgA [Agarivorans sp. B2Z047]MPW31421.1 small ribosomal subunit biogenesis GTPase RsgA [Agarivorans sp. B2Z047]UQN42464.1 small ribosomal subunit biogenesis GTPase RsgA [Agarivorans sp. B2Z047]
MTKRKKLSQGQLRRVRSNQEKRLKKQDSHQWLDDQLGPQQEGTIISRFGQHADVEANNGEIFRCNMRRSVGSLVSGDEVVWRAGNEEQSGIRGVIEACHERRSVLTRPDFYDGIKAIAANIDQVVIVSAVLPEFSTSIVDRYLVAVEDVDLEPIILLNKVDLLDAEQRKVIEEQLKNYQQLGYKVIYASTKQAEGLDDLSQQLSNKTSIFVGQSGVGKSSLVNSLLPEQSIDTKEVSEVSGLGQHTTTTARLYHLVCGGRLIDSPGVREFQLWHLEKDRVAWGFIEFRPWLNQCRFRDCKHQGDPGCAMQEAIDSGKILQQRFDSYQRILETMENNKPSRVIPGKK